MTKEKSYICKNCKEKFSAEYDVCPHCGTLRGSVKANEEALKLSSKQNNSQAESVTVELTEKERAKARRKGVKAASVVSLAAVLIIAAGAYFIGMGDFVFGKEDVYAGKLLSDVVRDLEVKQMGFEIVAKDESSPFEHCRVSLSEKVTDPNNGKIYYRLTLSWREGSENEEFVGKTLEELQKISNEKKVSFYVEYVASACFPSGKVFHEEISDSEEETTVYIALAEKTENAEFSAKISPEEVKEETPSSPKQESSRPRQQGSYSGGGYSSGGSSSAPSSSETDADDKTSEQNPSESSEKDEETKNTEGGSEDGSTPGDTETTKPVGGNAEDCKKNEGEIIDTPGNDNEQQTPGN